MLFNSPHLSPSKMYFGRMGYDVQIYDQLLSGSPKNRGLPPVLAGIVVAQSQWETGNYTSNVFLNANNAFGYGYNPDSDYQNGQYGRYGSYATLADSVNEIIDYIYRRLADGSFPSLDQITSASQYATLLKNTKIGAYFEDDLSNYQNGLQHYVSLDTFDSGNGGGNNDGLLLVAGLVIGAYFIFK